MLENVLNLITLVVMVSPLVVEGVKYLGAITHNKKVITLAERAMIIVSSLDRLDIANDSKKQAALDKLLHFANETRTQLTTAQAEDYIENAVQTLRRLQESASNSEVSTNAPEKK